MAEIELQPAGLVHGDLLAGIHHVCFAEPWSPASMAQVLDMPGAKALLALDGPQPAGLVIWRVAVDEAEILTIAVLPPWRRTGLGQRLMAAAMDEARQSGAVSMFLEVADGNTPALGLYGRLGFESVGRRKAYYNGIDALVLRRDLSGLMNRPLQP
jgi:ribosomal-protein-alanine N-acetyltransferase